MGPIVAVSARGMQQPRLLRIRRMFVMLTAARQGELSMQWPSVRAGRSVGVAVALAVFVGACTPPQYDDQTDKLISQLQTDVDTEIVSLITLDHKIDSLTKKTDAASQKSLADAKLKAGYDANTTFYDKVDVELTGLQTRVDAEPSPATPYLDSSIKNLHDNLLAAEGSLQTTHQSVEILSEAYLRPAQMLIDAQIGALLTRELSLKTGASGSTSGSTGGAAKPAAPK